jgi:hypothetical protein
MCVIESGKSKDVSPEQPLKASLLISVSVSEKATLVRPVQPSNAAVSMCVSESGKPKDVSPEQPLKAPLPIRDSVSGKVTLVSSIQS